MNEWAGGYPASLVTADESLEREFEDRLRDSGTLAVRVAYGVLQLQLERRDGWRLEQHPAEHIRAVLARIEAVGPELDAAMARWVELEERG